MEALFRKIASGKKKRLGSLLLVPSFCYGALVKGRNALYDWGVCKSRKASVPVVSVGSVVVGGAGKTPLARHLAQEASSFCRVAVVSRGYGRKGHLPEPLVVSKGAGPLVAASESGDEAFMLAQEPGLIVVVGKKRLAAVEKAKELGAELVILDDGFQHRAIARDIEIVFAEEAPYFLPRGRLRDDPKRIAQADLVIGKGEEIELKPIGTLVWESGQERVLDGKAVALYCGIAKPESFVEAVELLGGRVVMKRFLPDHGRLTSRELAQIAESAVKKGAEVLLCTEKDRVKLQKADLEALPLPLGWVKRRLQIVHGKEKWKQLMDELKDLVEQRR